MRDPDGSNPLTPFLEAQGVIILDGGLATELEARGEVLDDALWSAKILRDNPGVVRQVHLDYLRAGADCVVSASYQATFEGFARQGLDDLETESLLRRSVSLALEARRTFWAENKDSGRLRPLVAASVGPYGAFLADGSEFTGDYALNRQELREFHRRRLEVLADSGADLLACETVPSIVEARALCDLLEAEAGIPAWMTFSCRDGERISDGTPLAEALEVAIACSRVIAVGINCTAPELIGTLIASVGKVSKPLVVYPNSGESWDGAGKQWVQTESRADPVALCSGWHALGVEALGGCCRTGPADIRAMRARLTSAT